MEGEINKQKMAFTNELLDSKPVGFAVVGLGMGASRARLITKTDGAKLIGVADICEEKAKMVAEELGCRWTTNYKELLDCPEVEVVVVMTPSGLHSEVAIPALISGKHVIVTKPMEVSLEAAQSMIDAAQKYNRLLSVDFEARYFTASQQIKQAIDSGLFGKLILGEARLKWYRSQDYYTKSGWRGTWRYDGGGSLSNQTIHLIDLLQWFMGDVEEVMAAHIGVFTHQIETEDLGIALLKFKSGALGNILGTTTFPQDAYSCVEIHGEVGGVISYVFVGEGSRWFFREPAPQQQPPQIIPKFRNAIEDMVSAIRKGTNLLIDGKEGYKSLKILTAIYSSALECKPVKLD